MKILFVCKANVGRSQMAESIFKQKYSNLDLETSSAGTYVVSSAGVNREGQKLKDQIGAENVLAVLMELGIDASENSRTQITEEVFNDSEIVVVITAPDTWPQYMIDSDKVKHWDIEDPAGMTIEDTRITRDEISNRIDSLMSEIS